VGLTALALTLAGCSMWPHHEAETAAPAPVAQSEEPTAESAPAQDMTATEAATEGGSMPANPAASQANAGDLIKPGAPMSYTVKPGDTLWGISNMFLRDPWLWPEVWYVNPQVDNPHLIYPGDVLALAYGANGSPQIRLERGGAARLNPRLRSSPLDGAIPVLPYGDIAAFLSRSTILSKDDIRNAPHVVAFRDNHTMAATGNDVYVRKVDGGLNSRYSVVHVGDPIRDSEDGDVLGYQGIYTATAQVTRPGDPAKVALTDISRETLEGDRLFAEDTSVPLNFVPSAPKTQIEGRIISVVDGVQQIGQYQIVVINRGKRHGIEVGNVLAVDQAGKMVKDRYAGGGMGLGRLRETSAFAPKVRLPDERAGVLLVFKTYDRASYGLIVGASGDMHVQDIVRTP
jgi:hypothetical protein